MIATFMPARVESHGGHHIANPVHAVERVPDFCHSAPHSSYQSLCAADSAQICGVFGLLATLMHNESVLCVGLFRYSAPATQSR